MDCRRAPPRWLPARTNSKPGLWQAAQPTAAPGTDDWVLQRIGNELGSQSQWDNHERLLSHVEQYVAQGRAHRHHALRGSKR